MRLQNLQASGTHVVLQVVMQHCAQAPAAQQGPVVVVEVMSDEGLTRP
ncbi:MAG: hypothetical protein RJA34_709, partial [Pseudomonadota bacterium]